MRIELIVLVWATLLLGVQFTLSQSSSLTSVSGELIRPTTDAAAVDEVREIAVSQN